MAQSFLLAVALLGSLFISVHGAAKLGVWWNSDPQRVFHFENYLGRQVDIVRAANGYGRDWADFQTSAGWFAGLVRDNLQPREIVWSCALIIENGATLDLAATGAYNGYYRNLARNISAGASGNSLIWIIPGYEFNGNWFAWKAFGKETQFINTFRQFVTTFRSVSNRFRFVFGAAHHTEIGNGYADPELCFPGTDYVDAVGCNFYNKPEYQGVTPQNMWYTFVNDPVGLKSQKELADSYNLPFWIPEVGFQGTNYVNGVHVTTENNITYLVQQFGQWVKTNNVPVVIYWDGFRTERKSDGSYPVLDDGILGTGRWPILDASFKAMFRDIGSSPTPAPTIKPTSPPTIKPTSPPTIKPTSPPTFKPTSPPTIKPTSPPTIKPTSPPTVKPTSAPTTKPTSAPTPTYAANLNGLEQGSSILSGYTKNDFVALVSANTVISNGVMTYNLNTNGCPSGCAGLNYATGGWRRETSFGYGSATFSAQGSRQAGSVLILILSDWNQGATVRILLPGSTTNKIIIDSFVSGTQNAFGTFTIPFDHASGYNTYTISREAGLFRVLANGAQIFSTSDASKIPTIPLKIELSYDAHSSWWGTWSYSGATSAKFNSISFTSSTPSTPSPTTTPTPTPTPTPSPYSSIYNDALRGCWSNITYGPIINYRSTSFVRGSYSIAMPVGAWYGMYLQCSSNVPLAQFNAISFWLNGGTSSNQQVRIKYSPSHWDFGTTEIVLTPPALNTWTKYTFTFAQLNVGSVFNGFMLQSATGATYTGTIYIDDIQLIKV